MNRILVGLFWAVLYVLLAAASAFLMAWPPAPVPRSFWTEFSIALGFIGLAQILIQFVLVARFRSITAPYGIDVILYYHRQIGAVAVLAVLAHPAILILERPALAGLLNPLGGSWASRAGVFAAAALVLLLVFSWFRRRIGLGYEAWRISHALLGLGAVAAALSHTFAAGAYVNTPAKAAYWLILTAALIAPLGFLRLIRPMLERRRPYRVTAVARERRDVWAMTVEPVGHAGMTFAPGQFVWLKLGSPFTQSEHPFSITSSAEQPGRLEFGIKEVGDFTRTVGAVPPGTPAFLEGPHGAFSIDFIPSAGYIFIAGGTGMMPLMSMIRTMADRADRRPVLLIYAAATPDEFAYQDELDRLAAAGGSARPELRIVYVAEHPTPGWTGQTGRVTADLLRRVLPEEKITRDVLICGPDAMIVGVERALRAVGVPAARIHTERYELV